MKGLLREIETRMVPKAKVNLAEYHEDEIERQWKPWRNGDADSSKKEASANNQLTTSRPRKIKVDNQGCIKLTENVLSNSGAKHIELRYHYVKDMWEKGEIDLIYEPTATMTADVLMKALPKDRHWEHATHMGVRKFREQVGANEATRR